MADFAQELAAQIPRLRRYARALTHNVAWADDLVQDTLERALRRRWLFRTSSNLTAWLFTILYRLYLNDVARRRDALRAAEEDMPESGMSEDMALQLDVRQALAQLSAEHRAVIVLVGLEQLSYKEAADVLGVPLGTVMSRLARARNQLRSALSAPPPAPDAAPSALLTRIK
jgi:RNA polymerase sigma-70 factor (ECF subfamily)